MIIKALLVASMAQPLPHNSYFFSFDHCMDETSNPEYCLYLQKSFDELILDQDECTRDGDGYSTEYACDYDLGECNLDQECEESDPDSDGNVELECVSYKV